MSLSDVLSASVESRKTITALCDTDFWNTNATWYTDNPQLSPCFRNTVLTWLPTIVFLLLSLPLELHYLKLARNQNLKQIAWNFYNIAKICIVLAVVILKLIETIVSLVGLVTTSPKVIVISSIGKSIVQFCTFTILLWLYTKQRKAGVHTSGPIWIFLFLSVLCNLPDFYSLLTDKPVDIISSKLSILVNYAFEPILVLLFLFECRGDTAPAAPHMASHQPTYQQEAEMRPDAPELTASFLSRILLSWFTSFLLFGYRHQLTLKSLWRTSPSDQASLLALKFKQSWLSSSKKASTHTPDTRQACYVNASGHLQPKNNVAWVITKVVFAQTFLAASFKLVQDLLQYTTPLILKGLLNFMSNADAPQWHGIVFAIGLLVVPTVQSIFLTNYFFRILRTGVRVKSMVVGAIYRKSLLMSRSSRLQTTSGEIINLMAVDSQRLQDLFQFLNLIWSAPLQITMAVYLLFRELGWSIFAGVATMSLMIPLNAFIARKVKMLQMKLMRTKDERIKQMNEILNGIKVIKLYAWENSFMANILKLRAIELSLLRRIGYFESAQNCTWLSSPFIVAFVTFTVYLSVDASHILTAEKAFVSISLFNLLRFPLAMLPSLISSIILASVSFTRINKFLNGDELVRYVTRNDELEAIAIEHGALSWLAGTDSSSASEQAGSGGQINATAAIGESLNDAKPATILKDITLHVRAGSFVAVVGKVGSGKSSLLAAILGEMNRLSGRFNITRDASIAYVPQQAWIQNMSVRDNILFGSEFDVDRYKQTISVCSLQPDLSSFPTGDLSEVGESGLNLSGGQKQRVNLARAIYSNSDIYLLDDPLSALDSHIAKHVFNRVLSSTTGVLRNKTRVLATNSLFVLKHVEHIFVLERGTIIESGTYSELMTKSGVFAEIMTDRTQQSQEELPTTEAAAAGASTFASGVASGAVSKDEVAHMHSSLGFASMSDLQVAEVAADGLSLATTDAVSLSVSKSHKDELQLASDGKLMDVERLETGSVGYQVYMSYFKVVSLLWIAIVCICVLASHSFNVATNMWLSKWSSEAEEQQKEQYSEPSEHTSKNTRIVIYACLGAMQSLSTLAASLSLAQAAIRGAKRLHSRLLTSVMHSPTTSFFDTTPIGRIVNRFAKDIDVVDSTLPGAFRGFLECLLSVLSTVFVICYSFPTFLIIVAPLAFLYYFVQRVFVVTSRQLKRLESITRSPIYSNFSETIAGLSMIRAYGCEPRFVAASDALIDANQSCQFPNVAANRWLSLRLESAGSLVSCLAGIFSVLGKGSISVGLVGLAISYSLSITQTLSWLVRQSSEVETNVVGVERILEYIRNKSEDEWLKKDFDAPPNWPQDGAIQFNNYSARYRYDTQLVLRNLSLQVAGGEKIGVVGRTGSGKTSMSLALFRILEAASGEIRIDGVEISSCGLHDLRSRLTIIPQDSVLFSGTLRFNLDPLQAYSDEQIWRALELSHLKWYVEQLPGRLEFAVSEYGENFSHGQRQLVCLARAVLRNSKIIILDEATAAVDVQTDELIQKTIRDVFKASTILTIAHRLETILDSDRILVLDSGQVLELDSPTALIQRQQSMFASLVGAANIAPSAVLKAASKSGKLDSRDQQTHL